MATVTPLNSRRRHDTPAPLPDTSPLLAGQKMCLEAVVSALMREGRTDIIRDIAGPCLQPGIMR